MVSRHGSSMPGPSPLGLGSGPLALPDGDAYARWRCFVACCAAEHSSGRDQPGAVEWLARRALASRRSLRTR
jgi:hypothetical protein